MTKKITLPTDEKTMRSLKCGDFVEIFGTMYTGRDAAHTFLTEKDRPEFRERLKGRFIYHCGPVVKKTGNEYSFVSAGPTTSAREEPYQADVFKNYEVRGVIGKGGMGPKTLAGCKESGAVYLHALGGAGALTAASVKKVTGVYMLEEFGVPEAFWQIEVERFPAIVTMDAHGESLHAKVKADSEKAFKKLAGI
ncbi:MAG: FumA C-terminus/TtdB family hydratase beta subunit [Planctomycetota bacterium]|jgi:fumarate hydratase class I